MVDEVPESVVLYPGQQIKGLLGDFLKVDTHEMDSWEVSVLIVPPGMPDGAEEMEVGCFHMSEQVADPVRPQDKKIRVKEKNESPFNFFQALLKRFRVVKAAGVLGLYGLGSIDDLHVGSGKRSVSAELVVGQYPLKRDVCIEPFGEVSIYFEIAAVLENHRSDRDHGAGP